MSSGIKIDNRTLDKNTVDFDSSRPRLQIAVDRNPKHLDIFTIKAGNAIATTAPDTYEEEILATIKHNLGYKPRVLVYFYVVSTGKYNIGRYFIGFGTVDDQLTYRVDEENFYIIHSIDDYFGAGYTSTAPSIGNVRIKYMIFSNPIDKLTNDGLDS